MDNLIFLPYFLLAFVLAIFIPGDLLARKLKVSLLVRIYLALVLGMVLWAFQGFIFGWLHLRYATYLYLIAAFLFWLKDFKFGWGRLPQIKIDRIWLLIVLFGFAFHLSAVWFMGMPTAKGLFFCCRGVPDAVYHLSLTSQLVDNFPPLEPGMASVTVHNYHYLSNLETAELVRVFHLPLFATQYQFFSLLLISMLALFPLCLERVLGLKKTFSRWLTLFLFFSGDILYLLLFLRGRGLNLNVEVLDDATKLLAGPPRIFSLVILFGAILLVLAWLQKKQIYAGILTGLVVGSLAGFKIYTGIFSETGLVCLGIYLLYRRNFKILLPIIISVLVSLAIYLPVNIGAGGLVFAGTWRLENFILTPTFGLENLEFIRQSLLARGAWWLAIFFEPAFGFTYFLFLFGTLNLAFLQTKKSLASFPFELNIFLLSGLAASLLIGLFFVQKTGGANSVQFLINAGIIASVYAALACDYWITKLPSRLKYVMISVIILLTVPKAVHEGLGNFSSLYYGNGFTVSTDKLQGLDYLKNDTPRNSLVVLSPWESQDEQSLVIGLLSRRQLYLSGGGVLRDHGVDTSKRQEAINTIMTSTNISLVEKTITENKINYLYLPIQDEPEIAKSTNLFPVVFQNNEIKILKAI